MASFEESSLPDVFVFTEVWGSEMHDYCIPGYTGYHTYRRRGWSAGVAIYVRENLVSVKVDYLSFTSCAIEVSTVSLKTNEGPYIIMGIYRPHGESFENLFVEYKVLLNTFELTGKKCLIAGDFN